MSENIDTSANFHPIQPGKLSRSAKAAEPAQSNNQSNNSSRVNEIKGENKSRYKEPSLAQQDPSKSNLPNAKDLIAKEEIIKMTNPVLAAKLNLGKLDQQKNKKTKKTPPNPSAKIIKKLGGAPINPKRTKPNIPGRLKGFFDDRIKNLDKLSEALKIDDKPNLDKYKAIAKSLFEESFDFSSTLSFADKLELDYTLFEEDKDYFISILLEKTEFLEEPELKSFYTKLINQISSLPNDQVIVPFLQLFLPLPFGFIFADPDTEFDEEYKEIIEDADENFFKDKDEKDEDKDDSEKEKEEDANSTITMSVKTMHYNKLLFIIKYFPKSNILKLAIKGSPIATELAIPIESNLEDELVNDVKSIDYMLRLWRENVLRVTENRVLKVKSTGRLNPITLKACNSILRTIYESDIDLDDNSMLEADYNII